MFYSFNSFKNGMNPMSQGLYKVYSIILNNEYVLAFYTVYNPVRKTDIEANI